MKRSFAHKTQALCLYQQNQFKSHYCHLHQRHSSQITTRDFQYYRFADPLSIVAMKLHRDNQGYFQATVQSVIYFRSHHFRSVAYFNKKIIFKKYTPPNTNSFFLILVHQNIEYFQSAISKYTSISALILLHWEGQQLHRCSGY